mmetsp:Transcript_89837/g.254565  ORF Transcript_89837/g.254565 Transcript_89837/m.254565 type:complete len:600 (-) Transcript_89837:133-1932(-)
MAVANCSTLLVVLAVFIPVTVTAERVLATADSASDASAPSAAVSELELAAGVAVSNPPFDPAIYTSILAPLVDLPVQPCGTQLLSEVSVSPDMKQEILEDIAGFFAVELVGGKEVVVAVGKGWAGHPGALPIMDGHRLSPPGIDLDGVRQLLASTPAPGTPVRLAFDLGIDLRGCWGDIHDSSGRPVCGRDVLKEFAANLAGVEPIFDATGQSGSTIVTNVDGFIVKNTKDLHEYELLREVMAAFGKDILERPEASCYATALAPICAAFQLPTPQGNVQWIAMRKIEIPGAPRSPVALGDYKVKDIDVKGPKFANSLRDGKSYFGTEEVWAKKDTGFAKMFPHGLKLRGCGSRDAAYTLELDAELLRRAEMTDYSLFGQFYAVPSGDDYGCVCKDSAHPTFPLILDVHGDGETRPLRLAVGVIDYIERKVGALDQFQALEGLSMSTMKTPEVYKEWFMKMWPNYFHLPGRTLDAQSGLLEPDDYAPAEALRVGQRVRALTKMKWYGGGVLSFGKAEEYRSEKTLSGSTHKAYFKQVPEDSSETMSSGSKYKALPGEEGTAVLLDEAAGLVYVEWDGYKGLHKIFGTFPRQIIAWPPSRA